MTNAEKYAKVQELRSTGAKLADACKTVGMKPPTYYATRYKIAAKAKKASNTVKSNPEGSEADFLISLLASPKLSLQTKRRAFAEYLAH